MASDGVMVLTLQVQELRALLATATDLLRRWEDRDSWPPGEDRLSDETRAFLSTTTQPAAADPAILPAPATDGGRKRS